MTPAPWKQWEGQVVDLCFPLRRYLGGSDRSAVYLTRIGDPDLRNGAIKLIPAGPEEADPAVQWDRAARLSHPNLLCLLRTGRSQVSQVPVRYAVTEYADENLADVLSERPLTAEEMRDVLPPLLSALAYLHGEGLVHGRVKPANIMAVNDELKLSVDGITLVGEPATTSAPGKYDPPEFRDRGCSPVGDVWSFGVTVVEALTQQAPAANGPKRDPTLPDGIPSEFLPMVRACLRADPRRRATIDEIRRLLERPESIPAQPLVEPRPTGTPRKWMNFVLAGAAAVALAGVLAGPRLLRRPVASAEADRAAAAPAPTRAPAPLETAKPTPFVPAKEEVPAAKPPAAPAPVETKPAIQSPSADVTHQVVPEVSDTARKWIHGKVRIDVLATVDVDGHVADAKVVSQSSRYFAKLALDTARQWEFSAGPGEWTLRFEFTTAGTTVRPTRMGR